MDTNFNHEQSLTLINEMINRARNNVGQKGAGSFVFIGYFVAILAVANSVLMQFLSNPLHSIFVWALMIPGCGVMYVIERRNFMKKLVITHIDKIGSMVWLAFFIGFMVFTVVIHTVNLKLNIFEIFMLNMPVMLVLLGMGQFISACVLRQNMWYAVAAQSWAGAIICALIGVEAQFLVFAACMFLGFAVPGHILNYQAKKSDV